MKHIRRDQLVGLNILHKWRPPMPAQGTSSIQASRQAGLYAPSLPRPLKRRPAASADRMGWEAQLQPLLQAAQASNQAVRRISYSRPDTLSGPTSVRVFSRPLYFSLFCPFHITLVFMIVNINQTIPFQSLHKHISKIQYSSEKCPHNCFTLV